MRWTRHRTTSPPPTGVAGPGVSGTALANVWQVCSLCLSYPDADLPARVPAMRQALAEVDAQLPDAVRDGLAGFLHTLETTPLGVLQADYVETFDVTRKCSLHLTWFTHGDTRRRGVALVQFKQAYRHAGVEFNSDEQGGELPDHLPVVLEFGASVDAAVAWKLLNDHRVGIELLRLGLRRRRSAWLGVVEALRATLPDLGDDDLVALRQLIEQGPPNEDVGLGDLGMAPYAPTAAQADFNPRPLPFPSLREFTDTPSDATAEGALR